MLATETIERPHVLRFTVVVLGLLAVGTFLLALHITPQHIEVVCESDTCVSTYHTGKRALFTVAIASGVLAVVLGRFAARMPREAVIFARVVTALAVVASGFYSLFVFATNDMDCG